MKLFQCAVCGQMLFFENDRCAKCSHSLVYVPESAALSPLEEQGPPSPAGMYTALSPELRGTRLRVCQNRAAGGCNWALGEDDDTPFCKSCRLSSIIPDLSDAESNDAFRRLEAAKRRLLYSLYGLGLPVQTKTEAPELGLAFEFKRDEPGRKVVTGHAGGVITINVAEADPPFREKMRKELGERYRTLLGHFRHEIGHYYWERLVKDTDEHVPFRERFGDESLSYDDAMKRHYGAGPAPGWQTSFVSAYAAMHPWEDFAETWAHYLHMVDTLETARAYGLAARPRVRRANDDLRLSTTRLDFTDFDDLAAAWVPLTLAINSLNRSMGLADAYPFALSATALDKVRFVHDLVERASKAAPST